MKKIIIGGRGSEMSLKQIDIVKNKLVQLDPKIVIEVKIITTKGDKNMHPIPLDSEGKGWFTKEIDRSLLDGEIDAAVHSLKDLPEELPEGIVFAAIPQREDAREVLVSKKNIPFRLLPEHAVIGTDSNRRKSQLLYQRPDLTIKSIRGNVNTRLRKLREEDYDGLILAAAGLIRLNMQEIITGYFDLPEFIPSPGQGALAVVIRHDKQKLLDFISKINDRQTVEAVTAERSFSAAVGGGCKTPVGAYAGFANGKLQLYGLVGSLDGKHIAADSVAGAGTEAEKLGKALAKKILRNSSSWYRPTV